MEKKYSLNISYDKRFMNDECYSMSQQINLIVKGVKENIEQFFELVQKIVKNLEVRRKYNINKI